MERSRPAPRDGVGTGFVVSLAGCYASQLVLLALDITPELTFPLGLYFLFLPFAWSLPALWLFNDERRRTAFGLVLGAWCADLLLAATFLHLLASALSDA